MEILARTQPRSVSFEPRGTTHDLTTEEIAAMLLGVHDGVFYLAMQIVCGGDYQKIITHYLYNHKLHKLYKNYQMDESERGRGRKDGFLWHLSYLAVNEYIDPCNCPTCAGTGFIEVRPCPQCSKGKIKLDDRQKSIYLKIKPNRFNYWKPLYENIRYILSDWDCEARFVLESQDIEL